MNHRYTIMKDINLNIQLYVGDMTLMNAKDLKLQVINDPSFKADSNTIIDCRKADIKLTNEELYNLGHFINSKTKKLKGNKLAIITSNPNQVFKSTIFTLNPNLKNVHYKIFSTISGAAHWLQIQPQQTRNIERKIDFLERGNKHALITKNFLSKRVQV